jgi:predicted AlkP superfamily pyrophosphatase or phosphodiesterase
MVAVMPHLRPTTSAALLVLVSCLLAVPAGQARVELSGQGPATAPSISHVVVISIDGLNPRALRALGEAGAPVLHGIMRDGASTLNARTARESTMTLPNHTGMVTGRRVDADDGGHGVFWNDERLRPPTVHKAAGRRVDSLFTVVHEAGEATGLFASKLKFALWTRSWPDDIDVSMLVDENDRAVLREVRTDLRATPRALRFVHFAAPDIKGHVKGFLSPAYLEAVRGTDRRVGRIMDVIAESGLAASTAVVITSDHGGAPPGHYDPERRANFTVPFMVVGPGVAARADLYDLNPDYRDPGRRRTGYGAPRQAIRNGDVANLVARLLGLDPVPGSEHGAVRDIDVASNAG